MGMAVKRKTLKLANDEMRLKCHFCHSTLGVAKKPMTKKNIVMRCEKCDKDTKF